MICGFVCEYCAYSEPYGSDIGQEAAQVVRARIVRHEQMCQKNPLVITITAIRDELKAIKVLPATEVEMLKAIKAAIQMTYDCFGPCVHKNTYRDRIESTDTEIEVCKECGASRSIWEEGKTDWDMIDIEAEKKKCSKCFGDPVAINDCKHCNRSGLEPVEVIASYGSIPKLGDNGAGTIVMHGVKKEKLDDGPG